MSGTRKPDLTRWNRAGLSRFAYVDGDAASWLEELRLAMRGLYARGGAAETRHPDVWRDAYMAPKDDWPTADARPAWARLDQEVPARPETRGARTARLLEAYGAPPDGDHAWEINRAFARAAHVLLGHLDAQANEGYLRTATQWDSLRRLSAMVNYQPAPPASAITTIALSLQEGSGTRSLPRGLRFEHTPPEGGAPLVFETVAKVQAHPALNSVAVVGWDADESPLALGSGKDPRPAAWETRDGDALPVGALVVLSSGARAEAFAVAASVPGPDPDSRTLTFDRPPAMDASRSALTLYSAPQDLRVGRAAPRSAETVVTFEAAQGVAAGDIVYVVAGAFKGFLAVTETDGKEITLPARFDADLDDLTIRPLAALAANAAGEIVAPRGTPLVHYHSATGVAAVAPGTQDPARAQATLFRPRGMTQARAFIDPGPGFDQSARVIRRAAMALPEAAGQAGSAVSFAGKPPRGLHVASVFVARDVASNALTALRVKAVQAAAGRYTVSFHEALSSAADRTEFHGPLTRKHRPLGHARNPAPATRAGTAQLGGLPPEARALLKPGRQAIAAHPELGHKLLTLTAVSGRGAETEISFAPALPAAWDAGGTRFHLNCALLSHGETQGPQTLGSGDGERAAQSFPFPPAEITHIPSTTTENGTIPDMDVLVDGEIWAYRDYVDPAAEGQRAWSTTLTEDGTHILHFRRRLPTGSGNVVVARHRVGAGLSGNGLPPLALTAPAAKHRDVASVLQPFASAGGADREAVSQLRTTTPARLAANGRAVSLADFEGLARAQASVLHAHAALVPAASATQQITLTLALEGGAALTPTLEETLRPALLAQAVPGVRVSFAPYGAVPLFAEARVRADLRAHDPSDLKASCEAALARHFALGARRFGQIAHRSEIMAVLESITGVETAQIDAFETGPAHASRTIRRNGVTAAIRPGETEIAHVTGPVGAALQVTVEDIR